MQILRTRAADFSALEKVCRREPTAYPVLFEIFMDRQYYEYFSGKSLADVQPNSVAELELVIEAFYNAGYVYASTHGSNFYFPIEHRHQGQSVSLNDGAVITDWDSFHTYAWPDPEIFDYSKLAKIEGRLPDNMKLVIMGPGGVLENVTALVGYDNMCFMLYEDPALLEAIFEKVGSAMVGYYKKALAYPTVGGIISNDDWGFNTQTFLSTADMRHYVFPWHKKIAATAHAAGKFAILHSCGCMNEVFDDIIDDMRFDAKHSYEDNILSVEKSFAKWGDRIAIMGGLDLNYMITADIDHMITRATNLATLGVTKGGYALGSGNSMCFYLPEPKVLAMLEIANNWKSSK